MRRLGAENVFFVPEGSTIVDWQVIPGMRPAKERIRLCPEAGNGFSPGFQPRETPRLVFCPKGAWEIEPVDLRSYQSIGKVGQPSRLALPYSHVWCWINNETIAPS